MRVMVVGMDRLGIPAAAGRRVLPSLFTQRQLSSLQSVAGPGHLCSRITVNIRPQRSWQVSSQSSSGPLPEPLHAGAVSTEQHLGRLCSQIANYFPLWLVLGCGVALWKPSALNFMSRDHVSAGLAVTMLAMGMTLSTEDFKEVAKNPALVGLGAALQYSIMPLMGFLVSRLANLPSAAAVGICIVACCPGGVASNVVTFLANADVPLSVCMTTVSTFAAVLVTPVLTRLLVGTLVPVDAAGLLLSTLQVVLAPVVAGALLNRTFPRQVARAAAFTPLLAVAMTVAICASIIAASAGSIQSVGLPLLLAVTALHTGGFALGYLASGMAGLPERQRRTISIEVGMQNSALGAVLAGLHFADPLTSVPCAISACTHSLLGSALATYFRSRDRQQPALPKSA